MQSCKQQIEQKDQKVKQLLKTIQEKEDVLSAKLNELNQITSLLSKESVGSNSKMKSYILNAKLKTMKQDIRRLRNEKLDLEATEVEYSKELDNLKFSVKEMEKKNSKELQQVNELENKVGTITAQINDDIVKHSFVESSEVKLEKVLRKEKEKKEKLLKEVNTKKGSFENNRYGSKFLDTKTVKPIDWNHIEEDQASYYSQAKDNCNETSKLQSSIDDGDKQENLSFISFEADWETTQSDSRLPIGFNIDSNKKGSRGSRTPGKSICSPLASSSTKRSKFDVQRIDTDQSDKIFLSCNKILEEADEDSVYNLTPRLDEGLEREANLLEESQSPVFLRKSNDDGRKKEIYASKTTLETEVTSVNKFEEDSESTTYDIREREHPLSLSIISSGDMSNEERFVSPTAASVSHKVPALNLSKVRKSMGLTSLNSSYMSTTNYSSNDSKVDRRTPVTKNAADILKSLAKAINEDSDCKPAHLKNQLSHGKPATNKKLTKGLKTVTGHYYKSLIKHVRQQSNDNTDSWRESKAKGQALGFAGEHWDFNKKESLQRTKPKTT
jgi:hypothetical protein